MSAKYAWLVPFSIFLLSSSGPAITDNEARPLSDAPGRVGRPLGVVGALFYARRADGLPVVFCTATRIADNLVLTAQHCVRKLPVGTLDLSATKYQPLANDFSFEPSREVYFSVDPSIHESHFIMATENGRAVVETEKKRIRPVQAFLVTSAYLLPAMDAGGKAVIGKTDSFVEEPDGLALLTVKHLAPSREGMEESSRFVSFPRAAVSPVFPKLERAIAGGAYHAVGYGHRATIDDLPGDPMLRYLEFGRAQITNKPFKKIIPLMESSRADIVDTEVGAPLCPGDGGGPLFGLDHTVRGVAYSMRPPGVASWLDLFANDTIDWLIRPLDSPGNRPLYCPFERKHARYITFTDATIAKIDEIKKGLEGTLQRHACTIKRKGVEAPTPVISCKPGEKIGLEVLPELKEGVTRFGGCRVDGRNPGQAVARFPEDDSGFDFANQRCTYWMQCRSDTRELVLARLISLTGEQGESDPTCGVLVTSLASDPPAGIERVTQGVTHESTVFVNNAAQFAPPPTEPFELRTFVRGSPPSGETTKPTLSTARKSAFYQGTEEMRSDDRLIVFLPKGLLAIPPSLRHALDRQSLQAEFFPSCEQIDVSDPEGDLRNGHPCLMTSGTIKPGFYFLPLTLRHPVTFQVYSAAAAVRVFSTGRTLEYVALEKELEAESKSSARVCRTKISANDVYGFSVESPSDAMSAYTLRPLRQADGSEFTERWFKLVAEFAPSSTEVVARSVKLQTSCKTDRGEWLFRSSIVSKECTEAFPKEDTKGTWETKVKIGRGPKNEQGEEPYLWSDLIGKTFVFDVETTRDGKPSEFVCPPVRLYFDRRRHDVAVGPPTQSRVIPPPPVVMPAPGAKPSEP